jgi:drug/metabolite transporter superfamily protein YnfA
MLQKRAVFGWRGFAWIAISLQTIQWIVLALWLLALPFSMIASRETQPRQRRVFCAWGVIFCASINLLWSMLLWHIGAKQWYLALVTIIMATDFIVSSIQILRKVK